MTTVISRTIFYNSFLFEPCTGQCADHVQGWNFSRSFLEVKVRNGFENRFWSHVVHVQSKILVQSHRHHVTHIDVVIHEKVRVPDNVNRLGRTLIIKIDQKFVRVFFAYCATSFHPSIVGAKLIFNKVCLLLLVVGEFLCI